MVWNHESKPGHTHYTHTASALKGLIRDSGEHMRESETSTEMFYRRKLIVIVRIIIPVKYIWSSVCERNIP